MSTGCTPKFDYGACEQQQQPQQQDASKMNSANAQPKDWEERGTVFSLVAFSRIFLLLTLLGSLSVVADSFLRCEQKETPALKHYGEVITCHYTKAYIFTFPAMATTVLVLLIGRDFLQKRLYYGLLKNGGVITFSENKAYKDPLVMAMLIDFLHCVAYTLFHIMILHRQGQTMEDVRVQGFVPHIHVPEEGKTSAVEDPMGFLLAALGGGGPKLGGAGTRGTRTTFGESSGLDDYQHTVMMFVATFMETVLLLVFIWYAYDITATLVPMSEYLNAYEDLEKDQHRFAIPRLHTFKDTVARHILSDTTHITPTVKGDLDKIYQRVVTKYKIHKSQIRSTDHDIVQTERSIEDSSPGRFAWTSLRELSSIGLSRSLWPAQLLLRCDLRGNDAKNFRWVWIAYAALAILALVSVLFIVIVEILRELVLLVASRDWEQLVPVTVLLAHTPIVGVAIWSFAESLLPFMSTRQLPIQNSP